MSRILLTSVVSYPPPPAIGEPLGGGFYIGNQTVDSITYRIVVSPIAQGDGGTTRQWKTTITTTPGTTSLTDGYANTLAMINNNAGAHPAGNFCWNLTINGFTDWYLPARDELNLVWVNRGMLVVGERNAATNYWSSSEPSAGRAWRQDFSNGSQNNTSFKWDSFRVRAVRRIAVE